MLEGSDLLVRALENEDLAHQHPDAETGRRNLSLVELLTPVVKGWSTEWSVGVTSTGAQSSPHSG
jgi:hypothetical protein